MPRPAPSMCALLAANSLSSLAHAQNCVLQYRQPVAGILPDSGVEGLRVLDLGGSPELFIGGSFNTIGGLPFNKVARFNELGYQPIGQGLHPFVDNFIGCCSKAFTFETLPDGPAGSSTLYIGGDYISAWDTFPNEAQLSIARWRPDTGAWESLGGLINADNCAADCPPRVHDAQVIATPQGPALVIGGTFSSLGALGPTPVESKYVGMWRGGEWHTMAGGMSVQRRENPEPAAVFALELFDAGGGAAPQLIAAGHFTHAGGLPADSIARWTGTAWEPLPGGGIGPNGDEPPRGQVNAMTTFNGRLIVGGEFTLAGGLPVTNIAAWDGTQWHAMGDGLGVGVDQQVRSLAVWDDGSGPALYAGGDFTASGSTPIAHLARWNGAAWEQVLDGLDSSPYAMTSFRGELFIGGYFSGSESFGSPNLIVLTNLPCCPADFNNSGDVTVQDIFDFLAAYFSQDRDADFNQSGNVTVQDIFDYLAAYFEGCPR
ncbi:MAG: hypothetical protein IT438_04805 [Phycisphaerales bacterium]|nr:hypothetical protein [Phycisphaerales bacterium]